MIILVEEKETRCACALEHRPITKSIMGILKMAAVLRVVVEQKRLVKQ